MFGEYKYLVVDAQYYLRRNWSAFKDAPGLTTEKVIDSFLWTVLKFSKRFRPQKVILVYDKRPYLKESVIEQYKQDRYLVEVHYANLEDQLAKAETEEEKARIKAELERVELERDKFHKLSSAKYKFLTDFQSMGFVSYQKQGFEADDIAYLIGKYCSERNTRCLLVSADSDWIYSALPYVDVYRAKKNDDCIYTYDQVLSSIPADQRKISVYKYGRLKEIVCGSHNNVDLGVKLDFNECLELTSTNELQKIPLLNAFMGAMDCDNHYESMIPEIDSILHRKGSIDYNKWKAYHEGGNTGVYFNYYWSVVNQFNRNLFTPIEG